MKKNRQMKILELIEQNQIATQEELIERLSAAGFGATQATVSRDIRNLKLVKVMEDGVYRYKQAQQDSIDNLNAEEFQAYADSILNVVYSMNNVVVRTKTGMASPVALLIDKKVPKLVLGTVAGDDTVIVVTRGVEESTALTETIREFQAKREI